jgi:hypothetical protein
LAYPTAVKGGWSGVPVILGMKEIVVSLEDLVVVADVLVGTVTVAHFVHYCLHTLCLSLRTEGAGGEQEDDDSEE